MGGFNFDFSAMQPYFSGLASRTMQALDYNLGQLPRREHMANRAYAEWLTNNAHKRTLAGEDAKLRRRGFDAAEALSRRQEQQATNDRFAQRQLETAVNVPGPSNEMSPTTMPATRQWGQTAQRMNRMARARMPIATYDPIDRMADAAGKTEAAVKEAGSSHRFSAAPSGMDWSGPICPPGYVRGLQGGCIWSPVPR